MYILKKIEQYINTTYEFVIDFLGLPDFCFDLFPPIPIVLSLFFVQLLF